MRLSIYRLAADFPSVIPARAKIEVTAKVLGAKSPSGLTQSGPALKSPDVNLVAGNVNDVYTKCKLRLRVALIFNFARVVSVEFLATGKVWHLWHSLCFVSVRDPALVGGLTITGYLG
jgi:hypothetical protein